MMLHQGFVVVLAFIGTLHLDSLDVDSLLGLPDPDPGHLPRKVVDQICFSYKKNPTHSNLYLDFSQFWL